MAAQPDLCGTWSATPKTPKTFVVRYIKFKQRGQTLGYFVKMLQRESITNKEDPDQTAPRGALRGAV